jgi:hypothetical protein
MQAALARACRALVPACVLLAAAGITREQIVEFQSSTDGFSISELMELLTAVAAGLGGGATASRFGKARNSGQVEKLA